LPRPAIGGGILAFQARSDRRDLRLRLVDANTRLQLR